MQKFNQIYPTLINHKLFNEYQAKLFATNLSNILQAGDIIALWGDVGAGKTTLARHLIKNLCGDKINVPSPTFSLLQIYDTAKFQIWHMDLYRINAPEDVFELGVEDAFHDCLSLIEWPDKMAGYLPVKRLDMVISVDIKNNHRNIYLQGDENWALRLKDML